MTVNKKQYSFSLVTEPAHHQQATLWRSETTSELLFSKDLSTLLHPPQSVTPPTRDSSFGYNASLASAIEERISNPSSVSDGSGIENLIPGSDGGGIENPIPVSDAFLMIWVIIMNSVLGSAQEAYKGEMRRQKKNKWG
ncbi:unnamed protein product [Sphagnum balticum]